ncbi:hypothetical protein AB0D42_08810 [Streptomyces sp. NPDC048304]|uniref:hypothetical protein n=1 Tax=Streptomyces sp. NPDC048304 TaxID=3154820 RepID=UPI0033E8F2FA
MSSHAVAKAAAAMTLAGALAVGAGAEAFASGATWMGSWTTTGRSGQKTEAHSVSKGQHFLHFGIKGNGAHGFTATVYKEAPGKDPAIQTVKGKDKNVEYMAPWKSYSAGKYYIVFTYSVKGKKAFGGVQ